MKGAMANPPPMFAARSTGQATAEADL